MNILDSISSTAAPFVLFDFQHQFLWALIVGICLAFMLGFGMGANDVSNAFGTSVGSKALTLIQAYILASIFETLGSVLVGYNVIDTMRKGVVDVGLYNNSANDLLVGQLSILGGCSAWLMIATVAQLPISTTHSIVGATLGFSLLCKGFQGIQWWTVADIVMSWFISPLMSGIISVILYLIVDHTVLRRENPFECGLIALPAFYFFCIAFNAFMVSYQGSRILNMSSLPLWLVLVISFGAGTIAALLVKFALNPRLKRKILDSTADPAPRKVPLPSLEEGGEIKSVYTGSTVSSADVSHQPPVRIVQQRDGTMSGFMKWFLPARDRVEDQKTLALFASIQVFTACFAGFAHGANDVSNAIAPLTALISIYRDHDVYQHQPTPIYVLLYGVAAICVGLWILGHRVIRTVGTNMSEVNPATGFTIEFGAALTALVASKIGLPISTTHCLVGSVVAVGTVKSGEGIDWKIFRNIAISWVVTLPVAGVIAAAMMFGLRYTY